MSKYIDKKTGKTRYFIPIDGSFHETNEEIHAVYYSMDRRERYLEERANGKLKVRARYICRTFREHLENI